MVVVVGGGGGSGGGGGEVRMRGYETMSEWDRFCTQLLARFAYTNIPAHPPTNPPAHTCTHAHARTRTRHLERSLVPNVIRQRPNKNIVPLFLVSRAGVSTVAGAGVRMSGVE